MNHDARTVFTADIAKSIVDGVIKGTEDIYPESRRKGQIDR